MTDVLEPSNYEQAGWSDVTYTYVQHLRAALDRAEADKAAAVRAERERCASFAKVFLEDEGISLQQICDGYRDAMATGVHQNRKMPREAAKEFARRFSERSDAVYQMGEHIAAAIRSGGGK